MKRVLLVVGILLVCVAPSFATFTFVQQVIQGTCTATSQTCAITVASTGSGHVIVVYMRSSVTTEVITGVSGGGTYTVPAGCAGSDSVQGSASCAYTLSSTSSATTITVTRTSTTSTTWRLYMVEASFSGSSVAIDTGNSTGATRDQSTATTGPAGVTLTINGGNDLIVQMQSGATPTAIAGGTCSGTNLNNSGAYKGDFGSAFGVALCGNTTSGTAPTWTTASGRAILSAIAIAEAGTQVANPSCTPTSGNPPQTVTCTIPGGATGCYAENATPSATTAGTCDAGSTTYSGAISITAPTVLGILATESGFLNSNVVTYTYGNASTTFTAVASGDWQATTTWGTSGSGCHVAYPCETDATSFGDQVIMPSTFIVTCGLSTTETCSAGSSPANHTTLAISVTGTGGITIANGSTLVYAGDVSATGLATITGCAGCTIAHDSSWAGAPTTAAYNWQWDAGSSNSGIMNLSGSSGSHFTWQGDSSLSPNPKSGCSAGTCLSGGINFTGGANCPNNSGFGTETYTDYANIGGATSGSGIIGACFTVGSTSTLTGVSLSNVTFNNVETVASIITVSSDVNTLSISGVKFSNCPSTNLNFGCLLMGTHGTLVTLAGSYSIANLTADGPVICTPAASDTPFVNRNWIISTSNNGGLAHANGGLLNTCSSPISGPGAWDQIVVVHQIWNTGASLATNPIQMPLGATNSVFWSDRVAQSSQHASFAKNIEDNSGGGGGGAYQFANNVIGGIGSAAPPNGLFSVQAGGSPAVATTAKFIGNLELCGYNGYGTGMMPGGYIAVSSTGSPAQLVNTVTGNTVCNIFNTSGNQPTMGAAAAESVTAVSGTITSIDSNIFFNNLSGGNAMNGVQGPADASASATMITTFGLNGIINDNPWTQQYSGNNFVGSFNADKDLGVKTPSLVEASRSVSLFDSEYLCLIGLLCPASYSASPWATSTSYSVGNVVSITDPTVWGGKTTYWRCTQAHTSSSLNEPIFGFDSGNQWVGPTAYWEEAFWQYFRTQVAANTTFDSQCSALLFVTCPTPHTYMTGLLNAWLREGYTSMESQLWNTCSANGGSTKQECGAVKIPLVQHIPPMTGFVD